MLRKGMRIRWKNGQPGGTVHTINPDGETGFVEVEAVPTLQKRGVMTTRVYFHVSEVEEDAKPF